ncbi:MAG: hypothetical protein KGH72_05915 [Candidatus Micrarchaeota archaeon]|nr:hypothetical protein [Candidatus Micrarchaeota archaeon]
MNKILKLSLLNYLLCVGLGLLLTYIISTYGFGSSLLQTSASTRNIYVVMVDFIISTTVFLLFLRFIPWLGQALIKYLFYFLVLFSVPVLLVYPIFASLTGSQPFGEMIGFISAFLVLFIYHKTWYRWFNFWAVLIAVTSAVLIGLQYGFSFILSYVTFIAVYDYVAVFITKHMQFLVVAMFDKNERIPQMFITAMGINDIRKIIAERRLRPPKTRKNKTGKAADLQLLGAGDLVVPGAFAVSMIGISPLLALATAFGAFAGLLLNGEVIRSQRISLPAIPLLVAPQIAASLLYLAAFAGAASAPLYIITGVLLVPAVYALIFYTAKRERDKISLKEQLL